MEFRQAHPAECFFVTRYDRYPDPDNNGSNKEQENLLIFKSLLAHRHQSDQVSRLRAPYPTRYKARRIDWA